MMKVMGVVVALLLIIAVTIQAWIIGNGNGNNENTTRSVIVSWDPNSEPDLAGYKIYFGNQTRDYKTSVDVGNVTEHKINDLETERWWHFAATAYDTATNESPFSEEVAIYLAKGDTHTVQVNFSYYNFPNPFNPDFQQTLIRFYLPEPKVVSITIYDVKERLVRKLLADELCLKGEHFEPWDGRDEYKLQVANGVYYAVLMIEGERKVVQIAVVR